MEGLFKIDKIHGKGLGWIALRDMNIDLQRKFIQPTQVIRKTQCRFVSHRWTLRAEPGRIEGFIIPLNFWFCCYIFAKNLKFQKSP